MKGTYWLALVVSSFFAMVAGFFFLLSSLIGDMDGGPRKGNLAIVEVIGGIFDAKSTVEELRELEKNDHVKAVILRVDSPGGSVGASQEIYESVKSLKLVKPVVVSMGSAAASGGYYISAPASRIVANEGTITGSIGVRMELMNIEELLQWAKVTPLTLKSGRLKDAGSPTRPMTEEERAYLEGIVKSLHDQFKKAVLENRKLTAEEVDQIADGRVLTGLEAQRLKLVDDIGSINRAIQIASELGGIQGEPEVYYSEKNKHGFLGALLEESADHIANRILGAFVTPVRVAY